MNTITIQARKMIKYRDKLAIKFLFFTCLSLCDSSADIALWSSSS